MAKHLENVKLVAILLILMKNIKWQPILKKILHKICLKFQKINIKIKSKLKNKNKIIYTFKSKKLEKWLENKVY